MEWVETTAKTIEEAKSIALDQLGVGDEDAEFEILDEPRPGLFGRMRGEARVRARVRPTRPRPRLERRDRKRKGGSSDDRNDTTDATTNDTDDAVPSAKPAGKAGAKSAKSGGAKKAAGSSGKGGSARSAGEGSDAVTSTDATTDSTTDGTTDGSTDNGRSESSGRARSNQRRASQRSAAGEMAMTDNDTDRQDSDRHDNDTPAPDAAEVGAAAVTFLTGLVDAFGLEADVTLHDVDDEMEVRVDGENLGIMVGPRGATLLAIQDITRVASQRRLGDHQTRLRIDVAGYREKRREALARFAHKVAADVMESGEERVLEPMPSADRKVIHDTLGDVDGVVTRSEGDDPRRYVVVAPAG
jgi:spoIIIJ-associated protein